MSAKKKSKPWKPMTQILIGVGFIIWGGGSLIYQMQPDVIGLKSIPIFLLIAGIANLYIGIKRNNNPEKDALAATEEDAINIAMNQPTRAERLHVDEATKTDTSYQFVFNSYSAWKDGFFNSYSDYYQKAATKDSPEDLTAILLKDPSYGVFVEFCLTRRQPEIGEFMFTISPEDFMMTNKVLYINSSLKHGKMHILPLCDIVAYTNKGLWMKTGNFKLRNGQELQVKLGAVPDERKLQQLQKTLQCEQVIDI